MQSWSIPLWGRWQFSFMLTTYSFSLGAALTVSPRYEERVDLWVYFGPIALAVGFDKRLQL